MNEQGSKESKPNLLEDKLLRREAGEDWHGDGLNKRVLGAIAAREGLMDAIIIQEYRNEDEREELWTEYESQVELVKQLKEEHNIGDPPMYPSPDA